MLERPKLVNGLTVVVVDFPAKVFAKGFNRSVGAVAPIHRYMVFEAVLADKIQQLLEMRHLAHTYAAVTFERVVRESALADIGFDYAESVVGADSSECHVTGSDSTLDAGEAIVAAERFAQNIQFGYFDSISYKAFGIVAAVGDNAFVMLLAVVIVPIHKSAGLAA